MPERMSNVDITGADGKTGRVPAGSLNPHPAAVPVIPDSILYQIFQKLLQKLPVSAQHRIRADADQIDISLLSM